MSKECKICGEQKPLTEFHKHHTNLDGLTNTCKACRNQQQKEEYRLKKAKQQKVETVDNELVIQDISFYIDTSL
jgi:hypothetical protein